MATIKALTTHTENILTEEFIKSLEDVEYKFQMRSPRVEITLTENESGYYSIVVPHYVDEAIYAGGICMDQIQDCISELKSYLDGYFFAVDSIERKSMLCKPTIVTNKADIDGYFHDIELKDNEVSDILDAIADRMNTSEAVMEDYWNIVGHEVKCYAVDHLESICVKRCNNISIYEDEYDRALRLMDMNRCPLRQVDDSIYDRINDCINEVMEDFGITEDDEDVIVPDPEDVFWKCNFKFDKD